MRDVLAIIPARAGSKGIPGKNFARFNVPKIHDELVWPVRLAILAAKGAGLGAKQIVLTTDQKVATRENSVVYLERPPELAQDDTPMQAVVEHVLERIPGPPDQIILLVQPTQPLREPKHLTQAIELLEARVSHEGCAISVTPTESIDKVFTRLDWELLPAGSGVE